MARPYILINKETLIEIEKLNSKGVPISKLLRDYKLSIASPTLQRLISYVALYNACTHADKIKKTIEKSLFPAWIEGRTELEIKQPPDWYYKGSMPTGEWLKRK